jgi:hypothetical protein
MEYANREVPVITIPKGTLLFRAVVEPITDFVGVPNGDTHCIAPHHNVWFYLAPTVIDADPKWFGEYKSVQVYTATHDLVIASLVNPSKFTRATRLEKTRSFMIGCDKTEKSCIKGNPYDPCFRTSFLRKYPQINGWIGIGSSDGRKVVSYLKTGESARTQYIHTLADNRGVVGAPEIVLYPLASRQFTNVVIPEEKVAEFIQDTEFNYQFITNLSRDTASVSAFMSRYAKLADSGWYYTLINQ